MGYVAAEQVTLPTRFLVTTAHLICVLSVTFDVDAVVGQVMMANPDNLAVEPGVTADEFSRQRSQLQVSVYIALACFALEFLTLLSGVSIFFRTLNCSHILLHFTGAVLVALFYTQSWAITSFIGLLVCFNVLPAFLELLTFLFVARYHVLSF